MGPRGRKAEGGRRKAERGRPACGFARTANDAGSRSVAARVVRLLPQLAVLVVLVLSHPVLADEPTPKGQTAAKTPPAKEPDKKKPAIPIAWETDYRHAMEVANQKRKLLVIFFRDEKSPLWQRLERETLSDPMVREKLKDVVCARLPVDVKITLGGKETELLKHPAFREMLGKPGIAMLDFTDAVRGLHGCVVSTFPLEPALFYGPKELLVMLDLPSGTLTQRTLIYAVRVHPEHPASAIGQPHRKLVEEAESHSGYQAKIHLQGHHRWDARFPRIGAMLGCSPREVCAESWPNQNLVEAAVECVRCWRLSHGHWNAVEAKTSAFGYDMKLGANGVWYATGIFAMR